MNKFPTPKNRVFNATFKRNNEAGLIEGEIDCKSETIAFLKTIDGKFDGITRRWIIPICYSARLDSALTDLGYVYTYLNDEGKFKAKP